MCAAACARPSRATRVRPPGTKPFPEAGAECERSARRGSRAGPRSLACACVTTSEKGSKERGGHAQQAGGLECPAQIRGRRPWLRLSQLRK